MKNKALTEFLTSLYNVWWRKKAERTLNKLDKMYVASQENYERMCKEKEKKKWR